MAIEARPPPDQRPGGRDGPDLTDRVLETTQYLYALVLLIAFITCAAWYSVANTKKEEDDIEPQVKGPGGKPLPTTKRKKRGSSERKIGPNFGCVAKNVCRYLAGVVFLCYIATGASMFDHAFHHDDPFEWAKTGLPWAGEWTVVCDLRSGFGMFGLALTPASRYTSWARHFFTFIY